MEDDNKINDSDQTVDQKPIENKPQTKRSFKAADLMVKPIYISTKRFRHTVKVKHPKSGEDIFRIRTGEDKNGVGWTDFYAYIFVSERGMSLEDKTYIIHPDFIDLFEQRRSLKKARFYVYVLHDTGAIGLSYINEPNEYGEEPKANTTRRECYEIAQEKWICIYWNAEDQAFEHAEAEAQTDEPDWSSCPDTIYEVIELALKDKYVNYADHPLLLRLRGASKKKTEEGSEQ